jgi:hypothetical protein
MIDSTSETLLTFSQAADELPRRRRGRKVHTSTLHRWATSGCGGVVLETLRTPGGRLTSREALQRFFERLSRPGGSPSADAGRAPAPPLSRFRSAARRRHESDRAGRELEQLGA